MKIFAALVGTIAVVGLASDIFAQAPTFSPAQGQSPQQMEQDQSYCRSVAEQQTASSASAAPAKPMPSGGAAKGAMRGAAKGAKYADQQTEDIPTTTRGSAEKQSARQDEYKEEQMKQSAQAGMAGGAAASKSSRRQQAAAQQQAQASQGDAVNAAYKSCMMGRGYTAH
jgi:hypothetical protein